MEELVTERFPISESKIVCERIGLETAFIIPSSYSVHDSLGRLGARWMERRRLNRFGYSEMRLTLDHLLQLQMI